MSPLVSDVAATIRKYDMLQPGERALVAVSGGADSVALLLIMDELGYAAGVAHVNHGWRGADSDEDERFVRELAAAAGLPFFLRRLRPRRGNIPGNMEAEGRAARREFFQQVAVESGFSRIALAHHRDDRVETFLLHLLRGAGTQGLASMAPVAGRIVRPLIETPRDAIRGYLEARGQSWRTDATNEDVSFARNRLRHIVIPELTEAFNSRLSDTLGRTIEVLQDEDNWMRRAADEWLAGNARVEPDGGIVIPAAALASAGVPLSRRIIRTALRQAGSLLTDVTFEQVEQVRGLLEPGKSGKTIQIPGGHIVSREFDNLRVARAEEPSAGFTYDLPIPGSVHVPELNTLFRAEMVHDGAHLPDDNRVFVDGGRIGPYVRIRTWKPGDYYRPVGWPAGKLKDLFQRARIPRSQRSRWPVFVNDTAIVWVASFPVSLEFAPCGRSQKLVALEAVGSTFAQRLSLR